MWQAFSAALLVERSKFGLNELLGAAPKGRHDALMILRVLVTELQDLVVQVDVDEGFSVASFAACLEEDLYLSRGCAKFAWVTVHARHSDLCASSHMLWGRKCVLVREK